MMILLSIVNSSTTSKLERIFLRHSMRSDHPDFATLICPEFKEVYYPDYIIQSSGIVRVCKYALENFEASVEDFDWNQFLPPVPVTLMYGGSLSAA
jgi:hypothetical protein